MNEKNNNLRYKDAQRRQDINVESELSGKNDKYENNLIIQYPYNYIDNFLINYIKDKNKSLKFLDFCCGTGLRSRVAIQSGYECFGMDISEKSIYLARERVKKLNPDFTKNYNVGNAENLDFYNDYFDVIISYGSFSYLNFNKALSEIKRVLKPDGTFIILDTTKNNPFINFKRYIKYKRNIVSRYHIEHLFDNHLIDDLESNHFASSETKYFHFISTAFVPLPDKWILKTIKKFSLFLDNAFQRTPLKNFYWKFVTILKNPLKDSE